jgi:gamma-glutamyl hercynylcysteine S-oxide hydrolase
VCRHLAYVGPPVAVRALLCDAPHALVRQARHPQRQYAGTDNPDGWGVGWYPDRATIEPQRYRAPLPMWEDTGFAEAPTATGVLAAARYASVGSDRRVENAAPFRADGWLFSLNGVVRGFHDGLGEQLRSRVSAGRRAGIEGDTDAEVLFALVLDRLDGGATPGEALAGVSREVRSVSDGALNLLLTDGGDVAATAIDNSLFLRVDAGILVASEPLDDGAGWLEIDNGSLVENDRVTPIGGIS